MLSKKKNDELRAWLDAVDEDTKGIKKDLIPPPTLAYHPRSPRPPPLPLILTPPTPPPQPPNPPTL